MKTPKVNLYSWIKNSYLKNFLIPLIIFQFIIFLILVSYNFLYKKIVTRNLYNDNIYKINNILKFEENQINRTLEEIEQLSKIYGYNLLEALQSKAIHSEIENRLKYNESGAYYTYKNNADNNGIAIFYTGFYPVNEKERLKVITLSKLEPTMRNIIQVNKTVSSIYFNSFDSLNIIYPYFDVISQYGGMDDITQYNFYYEANSKNNPSRDTVWTNAYLDPAGHGWMISSLYPIYIDNFLEGVVGLDVTLETFIERIMNTKVPWDGYMMIVDDTGTILAIPPKGEEEFSIKELKKHIYNEAIKQDTLKPEDFNIFKNKKFENLKNILETGENGSGEFIVNNHTRIINWATIKGTSWKLLILSDKHKLLEEVNNLSYSFYKIGISFLSIFIVMQVLIFIILNEQIKKMSTLISEPLIQINETVIDIGNEVFSKKIKTSDIIEINNTIDEIHDLSLRLENNVKERKKAQERLFEYQNSLESIIEERTENLIKANTELKELQSQIIQKERLVSIGQLAAGISHEINNPIGFISSNLDILKGYQEEYKKYLDFLEEKISTGFLQEINDYKENNGIAYVLSDSSDIILESLEGVERIKDIVKNLRDFSVIDEESRSEEFDINKSISMSLDIVNFEYSSFMNISTEFGSTNSIRISGSEINQVVLNLLRNAIYSVKVQHKDDNYGLIKIITKNKDDGIEVIFMDNGIGINENDKECIFNPFFTTKPQGIGSGLGLYMAYDVIVNKHKGTIMFDSSTENTWFKFTLPKF